MSSDLEGADVWLGIVRCLQHVDQIADALARGPQASGPIPACHEPMLDAMLGVLALRETLRPVLAEVRAIDVPDVVEGAPATWSREHLG